MRVGDVSYNSAFADGVMLLLCYNHFLRALHLTLGENAVLQGKKKEFVSRIT